VVSASALFSRLQVGARVENVSVVCVSFLGDGGWDSSFLV